MIGDLATGAGLLIAAGAVAFAIVSPPSSRRSAAMVVALVLAPILVVGDQWDSAQVSDLRDSPARLALALVVAAGLAGAIAALIRRWPPILALLVVAALPFRVPLEGGGEQANLLVPLYLVIAAGVVAAALSRGSGAGRADLGARSVIWLQRLLAGFGVLYVLQALYSEDASRGLQNVCFFFIPFSLVFALLIDLRWDRRLLVYCGAVVAAEALIFAAIGFGQYAMRDLFWNDEVMLANDFHVYFRVNSLFWDPNIFGRYLALATVIAVTVMLWTRRVPTALALSGGAIVLLVAMAMTFSQSSYAGLLAGLAALAALRWSLRWTTAVCVVGIAGAAIAALAAGSIDLSTSNRVNKDTGGRANLISGGLELFADRPVWGYGSGSFSEAFEEQITDGPALVSESHTEPVTVAAEQGALGLVAYAALVGVALWVLASGLGTMMPGIRGSPQSAGPPAIAAAAILAAMIALLVHTVTYAGFFEDPITWVLLAAGSVLAAGRAGDDQATERASTDGSAVPAEA